jgi:hypothetical protein
MLCAVYDVTYVVSVNWRVTPTAGV